MITSINEATSGSGNTGTTHKLSARVRTTIQSIKEIVGNFSDSDIYMALKETNMDPNETAQKLLNQDPFHEVKRRREKKKEPTSYRGSIDSRTIVENSGQGAKPRRNSDHNARLGGFARPSLPRNAVISREFRIVRDNRTTGNTSRESKTALFQGSTAASNQRDTTCTDKGVLTKTSSNVRPSSRQSLKTPNGPVNSHSRYGRDANLGIRERKVLSESKHNVVTNSASHVQAMKPISEPNHSGTLASSSSVIGVYSSSTDPVHVPSPDSRSPAAIGAIKREVGVVGGRRPAKESNTLSPSNSVLGKNGSVVEPFQPFLTIPKTDQASQMNATDSIMPGVSGGRSLVSNHSRPHQHAAGYHKAPHQNKEWKPKSSKKSSVTSPPVTASATDCLLSPAADSKDLALDVTDVQENVSQLSVCESQNVIIAQHIRVAETDRCKLTFGSFGVEQVSGFQEVGVAKESNVDSALSNEVELSVDQVRSSESASPVPDEVSDPQLTEQTSIPPNLDNFEDIGLIRETNLPHQSESQLQQDATDLRTFSAYDPQTTYNVSYVRPQMDETVRQDLPSAQEGLMLPTAINVPASSIPMVLQQQQQQPSMAQMYPQLHVPHFANLVPYRQLLSPLYVPQMAMPGYSSNTAYPHHSNGNSYLLMPGGGSHISANGLKYGVQQFKPVPGNSPAGFGNFTSPNGYIFSAPGVVGNATGLNLVGNATGLEDSARIKFKDGNLYVPNPQQAETSDIWLQNPRELPGLQSPPYYNMPGQTPHGAYLPSHTGHASFNAAAAAQSSHMQYPGLYPPPPPQPAAMVNPHHLGPVMGGNVGSGVTPAAHGSQLGAYQQPQLGHLNWTTNF